MKYVNGIFEEFAEAFAGRLRCDGEISTPTVLKRSGLDYSLESLKVLDEYLEHLHQNRSTVRGQEAAITVLRAGAYLGEVIRRSATRQYNWVDYNDYVPEHPELKKVLGERDLPTCAFICDDTERMYMPLNKVARFISEGVEHSTSYFASVALRAES